MPVVRTRMRTLYACKPPLTVTSIVTPLILVMVRVAVASEFLDGSEAEEAEAVHRLTKLNGPEFVWPVQRSEVLVSSHTFRNLVILRSITKKYMLDCIPRCHRPKRSIRTR